MPGLFVEQKDVANLPIFGHLYLVFDDGETEHVLRGGPDDDRLAIEFGPLSASSDARGDETPADRGANPLPIDEARLADAWSLMSQVAREIAAARAPYLIVTQNSNSMVATLLAAIGIDIRDELPTRPYSQSVPGFDDVVELENTLFGSARGDVMVGQGLDDVLRGGSGADRLYGDLLLQKALPGQTYRVVAGDDRLFGQSGDDFADGGGGNDRIHGGGGDDLLLGGTGADIIRGGIGNDILHAFWDRTHASLSACTARDDGARSLLSGGAGDDVLIGGRGPDTMRGGTGDDVYRVGHRGDAVRETGGGSDTVLIRSSGWFDLERIESVVLEDRALRIEVTLTANDIDTLAFNDAGASIRLLLSPSEGGSFDVAFGKGRDSLTLALDRRDASEAGPIQDFDLAQVGGNDRIDLSGLAIDRILTRPSPVAEPGRYLLAPHVAVHGEGGGTFRNGAGWAVIDLAEASADVSLLLHGRISAESFLL